MRIVLRPSMSRAVSVSILRAALQQSRLQQKKVLDRSLFDVVHLVELVPQADGVLVKAKTEWK